MIVEDDADIGALCTVDAGTLSPTVIGRGAKLDSHRVNGKVASGKVLVNIVVKCRKIYLKFTAGQDYPAD